MGRGRLPCGACRCRRCAGGDAGGGKPDDALVCIGTEDLFHLGVLSSRIHLAWALAAGGTLEDRPRYNKTRCFDPFPFPIATAAQRTNIAAIAEELDALRRTWLDAHPHLTMTGLYNVLEKLRSGAALTPAEHDIHDAGQVSILRRLHDALDAAVADAYGWRADLAPTEIVARIVALNRVRRDEEEDGLVRWPWRRPSVPRPGLPLGGTARLMRARGRPLRVLRRGRRTGGIADGLLLLRLPGSFPGLRLRLTGGLLLLLDARRRDQRRRGVAGGLRRGERRCGEQQ